VLSGPPDPLPPWPALRPASGSVTLRPFGDSDIGMVQDLATDPYIPLIGTLPFRCDAAEALAYVERQRQRHPEGTGFSFVIADTADDAALGMIGLWLRDYGSGRAQAGYAVAPGARGRGAGSDALRALVGFAWTLPALHRLELHIEPWNTASISVARRGGFDHEGTKRSYLEIGGARRDLEAYSLIRTAPPDTVSPPVDGTSTVRTDGRPTSAP
jgi:ribosomal-protein-alanine N-acetyltransferase